MRLDEIARAVLGNFARRIGVHQFFRLRFNRGGGGVAERFIAKQKPLRAVVKTRNKNGGFSFARGFQQAIKDGDFHLSSNDSTNTSISPPQASPTAPRRFVRDSKGKQLRLAVGDDFARGGDDRPFYASAGNGSFKVAIGGDDKPAAPPDAARIPKFSPPSPRRRGGLGQSILSRMREFWRFPKVRLSSFHFHSPIDCANCASELIL